MGAHRLTRTRTVQFFLNRFRTATLHGAIERAASDVRNRGVLAFDEEGDIPVDLDAIARRSALRISDDPNGDVQKDAQLIVTKDGYFVKIRPNLSGVRRRFSIAHEIGHTLFYNGCRHQVGTVSRAEIDAEEFICDRFASALLMPVCATRDLFGGFCLGSPWDACKRFEDAARRLNVSLPALISRMAQLQGISVPLIVVMSRVIDGGKLGVWFSASFAQAREFIIWQRRTVGDRNLPEVQDLFNCWKRDCPGRSSVGRFVLRKNGGYGNANSAETVWGRSCLTVSTRHLGSWTNDKRISVSAAHFLYAWDKTCAGDAYVMSLLTPDEDSYS
jgi:Zn-dependent peptidase ImmA (M78 family)